MTNLILRLFVYNKQRTELETHTRIGVVSGAVSIIANLFLAVSKAVVGFLFNSISTIADAVNNLTDAASGVITLIGFKLSAKKPDADHPYGHGRVEYITGLIMAFLVLMLGLTLAKDSVLEIINPTKTKFSYIGAGVLVGAILVKLWLSVYFKKINKLTGSATFLACSADSRNDVISTSVVLASLVLQKLFDISIDGIAGLGVSVFIIVSGIGLVKETLDPLLGQPPTREFVDAVYKKTMSYEGIVGVHDLVVHNYGPGRVFLSLHAEVCAEADFLASHDLIDNIERDFKNDLDLEAVIHIDPVVTNDPYVNKLKAHTVELMLKISPKLTIHDFRAVTGPTHTNIIFDVVVPNDFELENAELKTLFDAEFALKYPNCNSVITFDKSFIGE